MPESKTTWSLLIGLALLVGLLVLGVVPRLRQSAELVAASTAPLNNAARFSVWPLVWIKFTCVGSMPYFLNA